ncbi:MAG: sodium:proton antiporter NhaD [Bacteroidota bacterium]|jgi:Na+/H+ antiporter NhaD/arsenite permease-like protein
MALTLALIFGIGYIAITLEQWLRIDKLIPALLMMVLSWVIVAFNSSNTIELNQVLLHHFGSTAEILFFLMGAMVIVELIDYFDGFSAVQQFFAIQNSYKLLVVVSLFAFGLSAIIDNLTATIVLISIVRKLVPNHELRTWISSFVIIAANAGGAWTPIGDVTTTMLWIGQKVTTIELIKHLLIPSLVSLIVPLFIARFLPVFKQKIEAPSLADRTPHSRLMLSMGLFFIVLVPVFKSLTHLPPYMGMLFSVACFAILAETISKRKLQFSSIEQSPPIGPTFKALSKIEMPSILFFLGILMSVAALEHIGAIAQFGAKVLETGLSKELYIIGLGLASAVIDNVPLVAASMSMFQDAIDHSTWHLIAYCAGTGGSILIIGSAAGVVAMGMEHISFTWYFKKIAWIALLGYLAGVLSFILVR